MDEKLYRHLVARMADMQIEMFTSPPKTMEEFYKRFGAWHELKAITAKMAEDAKGIEKD